MMMEPDEQPADPALRKSRLAVASLVFGILSFLSCGLTALPCVLCGHMANSKIKKGAASGKGLARAGLIMGYIGLLLLAASAYWSATRPAWKPYTLPSGKVIKLIALQRWCEAGEDDSLALVYQTDIDLADKDQLREEAEHLWQFLQVNAEREGMTKARILAQTPTTGFIFKRYSGFGFLIEKQPDGTWQFKDPPQNDPQPAPAD